MTIANQIRPARPRVLVVEDEWLVAQDFGDMLSLAGFDVVGPVMSSQSAEALVDSEDIGAALLDVNLGGETSFSLAAKLKARGIPFAFVTGYNQEDLPADAQASPLLNKPVPEGALADVVEHLLAS